VKAVEETPVLLTPPLTKRLVKAGKLRVVPVPEDEKEFCRNLNEPADLH